MPGTRRHQGRGEGVTTTRRNEGTRRCAAFGFWPTTNPMASSGFLRFHPERLSKPTLERQRASCKYGALEGRLAVLGSPDASTWVPASKATSAATRLGNGVKAFLICLTFDISGLPQAGPLDGGVRRTTPSKEMPGTRRHQRAGAGVRPPPGGAKALGDVLHLYFGRQPTRWAARVACIFTPDGRASQRFSGRGFRASTVRWMDAWLFLGGSTLQHGRLPDCHFSCNKGSETTRRNFWIGLTFDISGLPQAGPLDGGVRRTTLSREMPGTRRHQPRGAGVRSPLGGTKAPGDVSHLDFDWQPTRWAARVACIFTPDGRASQRLSGKGLRASTVHSNDAWLFLGCQMLQHGCPPRKRLRLKQGSGTTRRHF
jgi:hypothetical protein